MKTHRCNTCGKGEDEVAFGWRTVSGKRYPKHICNLCRRTYDKQFKSDVELVRGRHKRHSAWESSQRANNIERDKWIWQDSRRSDKKHGFENDLSREFIRTVIEQPCTYCGAIDLQMTLDRIDNELGHLQSNVVGSCVRCNILRRDMPHGAWLQLVPAVRRTRELGLFKEWTGAVHRKA